MATVTVTRTVKAKRRPGTLLKPAAGRKQAGAVRSLRTTAYHITFVQTEEGFAVWCDDLPGCCSQGMTRTEALANIRLAIREYLAAQAERQDTRGAIVSHGTVAV